MRKRLISAILVITLLSTLCGCKGTYASGKEGFTKIDDVEGVSFELVSDVVRNATAITNISEDMNFEPAQTYLYKDEGQAYFLFNISSIVCVVQKGTNFDFVNSSDMKESVENENILGVWFTSPRKKLDFIEEEKDGIHKFVATVTAQVTLTSNLYNDFAGKLATITDGNDEWSIFVGTIGDDYNDLDKENKEVINYMVETLNLYTRPVQQEETPAVELGGENEIATETTKEQNTESTEELTEIESETSVEETETETTIQETESNEETTETTEEVALEIEESTSIEESTEETGEELIEVKVDEDKSVKEPEKVDETKEPVRGEAIKLNNQKNTLRNDNTVYVSTIYDMLEVGKRGYAHVYTGKEYETANIRVDSVYTGREAEKIIRDAALNKTMIGSFFAPKDGCTWHVAHYTVNYSDCSDKGYMNVKLRGVDGENLRLRGITYTQRTYVINDGEDTYYCFYEVPNGCKEYVLECGEGTVENAEAGYVSAYYLVSNF